jgi:ribosomal protein S18 acetylase RimI-like enzyme
MQRRVLDETQTLMRNVPMSSREWRALVDDEDTLFVNDELGALALANIEGEYRLYWSFPTIDELRSSFQPLFDELRPSIEELEVDFISTDLVEFLNRDWVLPVLKDADFEFFAEWMELVHPQLEADAIPEFPEGVTMRRAGDDDLDRLEEIWLAAPGEYADGITAFDHFIEESSWAGTLTSDADDSIVAFALNGPAGGPEARIFAACVAPEARGHGYGAAVLQAAMYQLATQGTARARLRVRPDVPRGLRVASDLGFRQVRAGLEYRRINDEQALSERHEARRLAGVKVRFGNWR